MRISEVAGILGLTSKEVITEVENLREQLVSQGHKVAKRLTASSGLDEDAIRLVMATIDQRRQEAKHKQAEIDAVKIRAENEQKRAEEAARRQQEEEARKLAAEEARRRADEELKRRQEELARLAASRSAPPPPPAPPASAAPPPPPKAPAPAAPPAPGTPAIGPSAPSRPAPPPQAQRPGGDRDRRPPSGQGRDQRPPNPQQQARRDAKPPVTPDSLNQSALEDFVRGGMEPTVKDDYRPPRRRDDKGKSKARKDDAPAEDKPRRKGPRGRKIVPTKIFEGEDTNTPARKPQRALPRAKAKGGGGRQRRHQEPQKPKFVVLRGDFTVGQFADKLQIPASEVIKQLMLMGELLTMNQVMNPDLAEVIATELGVEISVEREDDEYDVAQYVEMEEDEDQLLPRPPVVTVMGHVDHGKTTLLDTIRKTNVVDKEAGGITQHIGAYFVATDKGDIVFLDTPGHEAFTSMRARGANITDLVILIVAANDGVKPQTVEAINHAKAAEVPIIVAINKIDVEGANPARVKNELMRYELMSEDMGGETIMVEISAKQGTNVADLLEMVALQAEVLELKANAERPALGTIIESHIDTLRGAVATVLVQEGTLRVGDIFVCGTESGRVRAMHDDHNKPIKFAGPATPVEILGITGSPAAGEQFVVVGDESEAREIAEKRQARRKSRAAAANPHVTLDNLVSSVREGHSRILNLIVKSDVQGSTEAIVASLNKIESNTIQLRILHSGVGPITEGDVQLADASDAIVIGFNVRPDGAARDLAEETGVQIKTYSIIYELLQEIESAMLGMLEPEFEEVRQGRAEVREVFRISKLGNIAGCFVAEGTIGRSHKARLIRGGTVVWQGKVGSLRRHKDEVKEVQSGVECGIGLENFNDIKVGDEIETYTLRELAATLMAPEPSKGQSGGSQG